MAFATGVRAASLALALGVAGAVAAEAPKAPAEKQGVPVPGQIVNQPPETILARDFLGQAVLAPDNSRVGMVTDLVLARDGRRVEGVVVAIGGFLGIGERNVALKMDRLTIMPTPDGGLKLVTDMAQEDLARAPTFRPRRETEAEKRAIERSKKPEPGDGPQR
jgi:sporulation protein YlmC with PRC-barrel domain